MALQGPLQGPLPGGYNQYQYNASTPSNSQHNNYQADDNKDDEKKSDKKVLIKLPVKIFGDKGASFMCEKCQYVPLKVVSCNEGDIFCKECIMELQQKNQKCPVSNHPITSYNENNQPLDNLIRKQTVNCLYSSISEGGAKPAGGAGPGGGEGGVTKGGIAPPAAAFDAQSKANNSSCPWRGLVRDLFKHLEQCPFKPVKCPFDVIGCNENKNDDDSTNKLATHYNENNLKHQNLILNEVMNINKKLNKMQNEINDLRAIVQSPGGGLQSQMMEIRKILQSLSSGKQPMKPIQPINPIQPIIPMGPDPANNILIAVGCNEKGDLGKGDDDNITKLQELQWSRGLGISKIISCSYKAFCFITAPAETIYVSGCNDFGQLGINTEEDQWSAKEHPFFLNKKLKIKSCSRSVNAFHIFFICSSGAIYCCGANEYGQLGLDDTENYITPQENRYFNNNNDLNVEQIACGEYHSLFLTTDGVVYSCGLNESFQLGYKTTSDHQKKPKRITNLNNVIKQIACGRDHSYCLSEDGSVFSFGSNYRGQLGVNKNISQSTPYKIHKIQWFSDHNKEITQISSGNYHGAAIDKGGNVFVWGRGDEGQIGNGKKSDKFQPTHVDSFNNIRIVNVSCGCHHTIALTEDYKLYCWGNNRYNQCSDVFVDNFDGDHKAVRKPKEYYKLESKNDDQIQLVSAGSYHSLLLLNKP